MTQKKLVRMMTLLVLIALLVVAIPTQAFAAETENFEMPHYNQFDYDDVLYGSQKGGRKTVADRGCGITSLAMVASYLYQDESITPDYLATVYGDPDNNPVDGVDYSTLAHIMVSVGTEHLGLDMELTYSFKDAIKALQDGKVIISLQNPGCFTAVPNGHFVVFRGITEDGRVLVNDPNGYTYARYPEYFADGFPQSKLWDTGSGYWIVTVADSTNSDIS
jgi:hypothetical protein